MRSRDNAPALIGAMASLLALGAGANYLLGRYLPPQPHRTPTDIERSESLRTPERSATPKN